MHQRHVRRTQGRIPDPVSSTYYKVDEGYSATADLRLGADPDSQSPAYGRDTLHAAEVRRLRNPQQRLLDREADRRRQDRSADTTFYINFDPVKEARYVGADDDPMLHFHLPRRRRRRVPPPRPSRWSRPRQGQNYIKRLMLQRGQIHERRDSIYTNRQSRIVGEGVQGALDPPRSE